MVEAVNGLAQFSTINYVKDGEKLSATKKDGIVTIVNEKKETRQMPVDDFLKLELPNAKDIKLEKSPEKDVVEIGAKTEAKPNAPVEKSENSQPIAKADAKEVSKPTDEATQSNKPEVGKKLNVEV